MAKDLISKYGAGQGIREDELRKSLRIRNGTIGGGIVLVLGILGGLMFIDPMIPVYILLVGCVLGAFMGLVWVVIWLTDNLPDHLDNIRSAKKHGVYEDR